MTAVQDPEIHLLAGFLRCAVEDLRVCEEMGLLQRGLGYPISLAPPPRGMSNDDVHYLAQMFSPLTRPVKLFRGLDCRIDEDYLRMHL